MPTEINTKSFALFNVFLSICFFFTFAKITTPFFDIYYYYFVVVALIPVLLLYINKLHLGLLTVFGLLLIIGLINVFKGENNLSTLLKVWSSTFFMYLFYFLIIKYFDYDIIRIFNVYIKGAFWVCILGFFQIIAFKVNLKWGYDYSWLGLDGVRSYTGIKDGLMGLYPIHSVYGEPAHFGCGIAPASFVALYNLVFNKKVFITKFQSVIIVIAMVLTTATTAYFAILLAIIILILNSKSAYSLVIVLAMTIFSFIGLYNNNLKFRNRVDAVVDLVKDDSSLKIALLASTGSVRILANNTYIAFKNASEHPLFGTGLGSHALAYYKYSLIPSWHEDYGLNYNDANSLLNRLLSETGYIGIIFLVFFLIRFRNSNMMNTEYWLINCGCLVIIFTYLLRQGHYFTYAFPLFVLMYYYSAKKPESENK